MTKLLMHILALAVTCSVSHGNEAQFTIRAVDESNVPINKTDVHVGVTVPMKPGWGWGGGKEEKWRGSTDINGICVVNVKCYGEAGVAILKDGYYPNSGYRVTFTNLVHNKWQPWNPTIDIVLKRIIKPVPLYAIKYGSGSKKTLPELSKPIGFDLEKGDWIEPYGKGKSTDFVFQLDIQLGGMTNDGYQLFDATFKLSFLMPNDGIQSVYMKPSKGSELRLPRLAPEQGYENILVKRAYEHIDGGHVERRDDQNYFFRVRTQLDNNGKIISALYGKIHGEIEFERTGELRFTYYLNPAPNDRNLEFDPKQNLFNNLSPLEEVREP